MGGDMDHFKIMTGREATDRFLCSHCRAEGEGACGHDCVLSATSSLLCPACRGRNFMEGDGRHHPATIGCTHCGATIRNIFRRRP